ncbi:MAG: RagB/SusD family nutrient uptake outer membrane protein, partial [Chitinophagales bacterium]|nr:RagB/SusD family nutrient uptake outer membrane protein [Chitinophagales bacterium]
MKRKNIFSLLAAVTLVISSCTKILDLEPAQSISNDVALNSDESVKQVLIGAYDAFSSQALYGGNVFRNSVLYAGEGEVVWLGTYVGPKEIFLRDMLVTNDDAYSLWVDAYFCINICNNVLAALPVVNEADRNRIEGEAKFLRACVYFELTRYFGQQYEEGTSNTQPAVPLITKATETLADNATVARNTVEECYAQIISDLTEAESLLPEDNDVYANSGAAAAILSRVYLQKYDYANARDAADRVISSGNYNLMANDSDVFAQDENTNEDIFAIQNSPQDGTNSINTFFSTAKYGGRGDIQIEQSFYDLFDPADTRRVWYYKLSSKWRCGKFNNQNGNLAVVRLAEMYLARAECNERLGTSVGATPAD